VATIKRQTRAAYGCKLQVRARGRAPSLVYRLYACSVCDKNSVLDIHLIFTYLLGKALQQICCFLSVFWWCACLFLSQLDSLPFTFSSGVDGSVIIDDFTQLEDRSSGPMRNPKLSNAKVIWISLRLSKTSGDCWMEVVSTLQKT